MGVGGDHRQPFPDTSTSPRLNDVEDCHAVTTVVSPASHRCLAGGLTPPHASPPTIAPQLLQPPHAVQGVASARASSRSVRRVEHRRFWREERGPYMLVRLGVGFLSGTHMLVASRPGSPRGVATGLWGVCGSWSSFGRPGNHSLDARAAQRHSLDARAAQRALRDSTTPRCAPRHTGGAGPVPSTH